LNYAKTFFRAFEVIMKKTIGYWILLMLSASIVARADEPLGVQYYGYYLSGEYISEVADHTNLIHVYAHQIDDRFFELAAAQNMKVMVDVSRIFFDEKAVFQNPNYATLWEQTKERLRGRMDQVAAFYVVDEPNLKSKRKWDKHTDWSAINIAVDTIRATYPTMPLASILSGEHKITRELVSLFDWVGIDCYDQGSDDCGMFAKGTVHGIPNGIPNSMYERFRALVDQNRQRIMLVPQAGMPIKKADRNSNTYNYGLPRQADQYYQVAKTDPLVIAVIPFIWQDLHGDDEWYGLKSLPTTKKKFTEIGRLITSRQMAPITLSLLTVLSTNYLLN
jgi:hypothetical protein